MLRWQDFSVPKKVIAILLVAGAFIIIYFLSTKIIFGYLTVMSPQSDAQVSVNRVSESKNVPASFKLKPGKYEVTVSALNYLRKKQNVTVNAFVTKRIDVVLEKDYSIEKDNFIIQYDYSVEKYLIIPNIEITGLDSPEAQVAIQWDTYEKYAQEALAYLKTQEADLKTLPIEWWAQEWWPTGKQIAVQ